MGTERYGTSRSGAGLRERQQELLRSLRVAADALTVCVERIEDLIGQVDRHLAGDEPRASVHPARVSFGGGPSVIGSSERPDGGREDRRASGPGPTGSGERRRGVERRAGGERLGAGAPELMAATELAHLGYSREEIAERLRARWGDRAAAILREALD